ncbi:NASP-related protein sim3 [Typha latifolia]|uniref:NASP-related protein sim3 n=1 Tax=Typha latifolia TaxID=4733 RepID=UPI003C2EFA58
MASPPRPQEEDNTTLDEAPVASEKDETLAQDAQTNGGSSGGIAADLAGTGEEGSEKTLARADEWFEKGSKAIEDGDFVEAVDCLSRALEIRVAHYGELAQECASSYYKYGCALLYKAQEETDPLGNVPESNPTNPETAKSATSIDSSESSKASTTNGKEDILNDNNEEADGGSSDKDHDDGNDGSEGDGEDLAEADEDESDLDLAWKMLDVARAIVEKSPEATMEKVNVWAALGEVSMEREDIETSLSDYLKALSILEHLVEPDHRRVVELNFRICLVLELGSKIGEAIPYCGKAISLCKSRLQRLREEATKADSGKSSLEDEIELLGGILTELDKKLEDLEQIMANPTSVISDVMKMIASKSSGVKNLPESVTRSPSLTSSQMGVISNGFDSPSVSSATNGSSVTHLGVVGRGIKRATVKPSSVESSPKRSKLNLPAEKADSCTSEVAESQCP